METFEGLVAETHKFIERIDELERSLREREMGRTLRAYLKVARTHFVESQRLLQEAAADCEEVTKVWVRK